MLSLYFLFENQTYNFLEPTFSCESTFITFPDNYYDFSYGMYMSTNNVDMVFSS